MNIMNIMTCFVSRKHLHLLPNLRPAETSSVILEAPSPSPRQRTNQASCSPWSERPPLQSAGKWQRSLHYHGHLTTTRAETRPDGHWTDSFQRTAVLLPHSNMLVTDVYYEDSTTHTTPAQDLDQETSTTTAQTSSSTTKPVIKPNRSS